MFYKLFARFLFIVTIFPASVFSYAAPPALSLENNTVSKTPEWKKITSIEEVYQYFPDKVRNLFLALDLNQPELKAVRSNIIAGDTVAAAKALLVHYRQSDTGNWLSEPPPEEEKDRIYQQARQLSGDTVSFSGVTARVPRHDNGGWKWDHLGPEHDAEFGYSLNGHKYLIHLLQEWQVSSNESYVSTFDRLIRDWIIHNPLPSEGDSIYMVLDTSYNLDWRDIGEVIWRDLEAGQRLGVTWPQTFYGFQQSEAFTPAARLLMLSSIAEQAEYLRHYHKKGHNWTTMEMNGLALVGLTFPEFKQADDWARYAMNVMEEEIQRQVYPDGVQTELSTKTQWVALQRFESVAQNFRKANRPVKQTYINRIEEMYNYLAYSMRPDGHQPLNNDSDREDLRPRVLNAAQNFKRPDWQWIATNGASGRVPEGLPSIVFPWAGIHVMRSGWDDQAHWAFFDTGPFGTGHQHSDMLHLSVSAYGKDLLVDGGRYTHKNYFSFDPAIWRGYFRSSFSHNVILVDGKGQNGGPLKANSPIEEGTTYINTEKFDYARGTFTSGFNGVEGKVEHTRAVLYVRGKFWVVVDYIDTDRPRELQALWHYAPTCQVQLEEESVISTNEGEGNLRIMQVGQPGWEVEIVKGKEAPHKQGWYSAEYGKKVPNPTVGYTIKVDKPTTFAWVLLPAKGKVPPVKTKILGKDDQEVILQVSIENQETVKVKVPIKAGSPEVK